MMFLGAGASKAAGLPLTAELLERVFPRHGAAKWSSVRSQTDWRNTFSKLFTVVYPQGDVEGFRPGVAELFTLLEVIARNHEGRARLSIDATATLRDLRREIARGLDAELASLPLEDTPQFRLLATSERPSVVVTSNWDRLVEKAAHRAGLKVLFEWPRDVTGRRVSNLESNSVLVLKLHGSTEWGVFGDRTWHGAGLKGVYAKLDAQFGSEPNFGQGQLPEDLVLRFIGQTATRPLGFREPLMATMAVGKNVAIDLLDGLWDDAYWALSRAARLEIAGYSFPADDLELRTLLRISTRQAGQAGLAAGLELVVNNPSPAVHQLARAVLGETLVSDYRGL